MKKLKNRYIIPIFNIDKTEEFNYKSKIGDIEFNIQIKSYGQRIYHNDSKKILETENEKELINFSHLIDSIKEDEVLFSLKTLLIIDFITNDIEGDKSSIEYFENSSKIFDYSVIKKTILETLHLILPCGLGYYKYASKSFNGNSYLRATGGSTKFFGDLQLHTSFLKPYFFSPLVDMRLNELKKEDYSEFENIFNKVYELNIQEDKQYSRILKQAIDYHILAKTFLNNEQTFAILMIAIEAMFKSSRYLYDDIDKLAKLLSSDSVQQDKIIYKFKKNENQKEFKKYFIAVRNSIVHGDEYLSKTELIKKLFELYEYVRQCILKILEINEKRPLVDYYKDLFEEIDKRWNKIESTKEK